MLEWKINKKILTLPKTFVVIREKHILLYIVYQKPYNILLCYFLQHFYRRTIMSNAVKNTEALVVVSQENMLEKLKHSEVNILYVEKDWPKHEAFDINYTCLSIYNCLPKYWYLSVKILISVCQNIDFLPKYWYLSARILTFSSKMFTFVCQILIFSKYCFLETLKYRNCLKHNRQWLPELTFSWTLRPLD